MTDVPSVVHAPDQPPLNLAATTPGYDLTIEKSESPAEQTHRLTIEARRAWITDAMWVVLYLLLIALAVVFTYVLFLAPNPSPEQREMAQKLITPLLSSIAAFVLGRASGK